MHQFENYHKSYIHNNYLQYSGYLYFLYHYFYCYHYLQFTIYNLNFSFNKNTIIIINYLLMSFFPDSKQVQGSGIVCLLNVLQVIGDNVYDLGKFLLYGSIFILCSFFSRSFFSCLRLSGKGAVFGEQIIIVFWNYRFHATIITHIYPGRTFVNLLVS